MTNRRKRPALSEKDGEIIAVGASVASGCLPCTKFHIRAASLSGASEGELLDAVREATRVRRAATAIMAKAGGLSPAEAGQSVAESGEARSLIRELVAISAAYAISCATTLEAHLEAARALGATGRQMFAAIEIACRIRDVASGKAKAVAGAALGVSKDQAAACECAGDGAASSDAASGQAPDAQGGASVEPCSCHSDDTARARRSGSNPREKGC